MCGFLDKNGNFFEVAISSIPAFTQKQCLQKCQSNPMLENLFYLFSQKYQTFAPYYDFLIHKLRFIHLGILGDDTLYGIGKFNQILIKKIPKDFQFNKLGYEMLCNNNEKEIAMISTYDDKNLDFHFGIKQYMEGVLFSNGVFSSIKNIPSHQSLIQTILTGFIATYSFIGKDIENLKIVNHFSNYFTERMGGVILASMNPRYGIYDKNLLSDVQRMILEPLNFDPEIDLSVRNQFSNPYSLNDNMEFINRLNKCKYKVSK